MEKIQFTNNYQYIISVDNLLDAWKEFLKGKRSRKDVQEFELNLMENVLELHRELVDRTYKHSVYYAFNISDPKPRNIHKASVRDRLLHHAIYRVLYPFFNRTLIADSYSCRNNKGVHKALDRFQSFVCQTSKNHTRTTWVLKCDIKKFFASIDQVTLLNIIRKYIFDNDIYWLIKRIVSSFDVGVQGKGLPLGNLTSQLLVNIYMNEFDQFVKHKLKAKYYIRYADDFIFLSHDKDWLLTILPKLRKYLKNQLSLELHPDKIFIKTVASGVDFLGWIHFSDHRVLRTVAKRRMFRTIKMKGVRNDIIQSYLGLLSHGNARILGNQAVNILNDYDD